MSTISDLITAAIAGAESSYESDVDYGEEKIASAPSSFDVSDGDVEKIASTLELLAEKGVEYFLKEAAGGYAHPSLKSNESAINYSPEERNKIINPELGKYFSNAKGDNIHTKKVSTGSFPKHASENSVILNESTKKRLIKEALASKVAEGRND